MNHHRASHRACTIPRGGTCVKLYYNSPNAMDGEHLAEFTGTRGESVLEAFQFIDNLHLAKNSTCRSSTPPKAGAPFPETSPSQVFQYLSEPESTPEKEHRHEIHPPRFHPHGP